MMICPGTLLVPAATAEQAAPVEVKVIRRSPVPYAEVEPRGGGRRRPMLLRDLERDYRLPTPGTLAVSP
ncbi:hypothetical protein ACIBG0_23050 [Nocardia sp. NPDC050630]|uniref:hypothetical protein n=1 Tax=Nocardia sp. NPDC050630 TaxID=3364321 RepID=UPI0037A4E1F6